MKSPSNPDNEDYARKLYEMKKAEQNVDAATYRTVVAVAKAFGWLLVGAVVLAFLINMPVVGLLMAAGLGFWIYQQKKK